MCHGKVTSSALPGIMSVDLASLVLVISLFSTIATPLEFGAVSAMVLKTDSLLSNRVVIPFVCSVVRWVSCRARIPIFLSLIIWLMCCHLSSPLPLMFRDAILIDARVFFLGLVGGFWFWGL